MTPLLSPIALISSLFLSLSTNLLLMVSHVAIDMHLYFWLDQLLLCFLVLLISFPSAFFSRMHSIINIVVVFAIIQHDGGTLNYRIPYYPIIPHNLIIVVGCMVFAINGWQDISPFALGRLLRFAFHALLKYAQFIGGFLSAISNIEKYNYNSLIYIVWKMKFRQDPFFSTCDWEN